MASDDNNVANAAEVANGAWLYFQKRTDHLDNILKKLSAFYDGGSVMIAPLLYDVTVENGFPVAMKTPFMLHDENLLLKTAAAMPFVFILNKDENIFKTEDYTLNIDSACEQSAERLGFTLFDDQSKKDCDLLALCKSLDIKSEDYLIYVVCCYGFKEFLFYGYLVPHVTDVKNVEIGGRPVLKVPMYCPLLFLKTVEEIENVEDSFILENGFYNKDLSRCLYYFVFAALAISLRYENINYLIKTTMIQYVNLTHSAPKLYEKKLYRGYYNSKLTTADQDTLALCDISLSEMGLSHMSYYIDSAYESTFVLDFPNWPMIKNKTPEEQYTELENFKLHLSVHACGLFFAENSVLYQTRLWKQNAAGEANAAEKENLLKSVFFCNGLQIYSEDYFDDAKVLHKEKQEIKKEKYGIDQLCYAVAFSPHLLSQAMWFLNRVEQYKTAQGLESLYYYIINSSSGVCEYCDSSHCNSCLGSIMFRLASRFPTTHKTHKKEPCVTTLVGRQFADVTVLGSYGKKYGDREQRDGKITQDPLDRLKYLNNILDYCKKSCLLDNEKNDTVAIGDKSQFVHAISSLNKTIDEELHKFVNDMNKHPTAREDIKNATISFSLEGNQFMYAFSPLFFYAYTRTLSYTIQNIALIPVTEKIVTYPFTYSCYSKWIKQHYQSIFGEFKKTHAKKGFFNQVDLKIKPTPINEVFPNFSSLITKLNTKKVRRTSYQCKLCEYQVFAVKDIRIKYRPVPKNKETPFFAKSDGINRNPIQGCLAFLLTKFHKVLFPDLNMSVVTFWHRVCSNSLKNTNVNLGEKAAVEAFMKFVFETTTDYDNWNVFDCVPECIVQYVEYRFTSRLLHICGYRGNYMGTIQPLVSVLQPARLEHVPCYLIPGKTYKTVADYVTDCKDQENCLGVRYVGKTQPFHKIQHAFEQRPIITFAFSLEKYPGVSGNSEIYQCGQMGYFVGTGIDRNLNTLSRGGDYKFMRRKYVLQTFLTNFLCTKSKRETVLFDFEIVKNKINTILEGGMVYDELELSIISEIMQHCNEIPCYNDLLFLTDYQEFLATSLNEKFEVLDDQQITDYSLDNLKDIFASSENETEKTTAQSTSYDFSHFLQASCDSDMLAVDYSDSDDPLVKRLRL